jgi:hypothetical protein
MSSPGAAPRSDGSDGTPQTPWTTTDLYVDLVTYAHGHWELLDLDELGDALAAGFLDAETGRRALTASQRLVTGMIDAGGVEPWLAAEGYSLSWAEPRLRDARPARKVTPLSPDGLRHISCEYAHFVGDTVSPSSTSVTSHCPSAPPVPVGARRPSGEPMTFRKPLVLAAALAASISLAACGGDDDSSPSTTATTTSATTSASKTSTTSSKAPSDRNKGDHPGDGQNRTGEPGEPGKPGDNGNGGRPGEPGGDNGNGGGDHNGGGDNPGQPGDGDGDNPGGDDGNGDGDNGGGDGDNGGGDETPTVKPGDSCTSDEAHSGATAKTEDGDELPCIQDDEGNYRWGSDDD